MKKNVYISLLSSHNWMMNTTQRCSFVGYQHTYVDWEWTSSSLAVDPFLKAGLKLIHNYTNIPGKDAGKT